MFILSKQSKSQLIALLFCSVTSICFSSSLHAQEADMNAVHQRISSMEQEIIFLKKENERQIQMIRANSNAVKTSPQRVSTGASSKDSGFDGSIATDFEVRLSALQQEVQKMTGIFEEGNYRAKQVQEKVERANSDIDYRLSQIEMRIEQLERFQVQKTNEAINQPPETKQQDATPKPTEEPKKTTVKEPETLSEKSTQKYVPSSSSGPKPTNKENLENHDGIKVKDLNEPEPVPATKAPATKSKATTPREVYEAAFALLRKPDYEAAEKDFKSFLAKYPEDPLAANAHYWLSETYYARKKYDEAIVAFADGYKKYPTHTKAVDNLFKLGMSFSALKKTEEACVTFAQFHKKFPKAPSSIMKRVETEETKLSCKGTAAKKP